MIDWNLQSRSHECQACQKPFVDKEPYHTVLFDERAGYRRQDVCEACWKEQFSQGAKDKLGFISHWQGIYNAPPAAAPEPIKQETAESLLRKLIEANEARYEAARYILAVMLERKRILKVRDQLRDGSRRVFVYEHAANGDVLTIPDPDLQLQQLELVQREVAELMANGLNPVPAVSVPDAVVATAVESPAPPAPAAT